MTQRPLAPGVLFSMLLLTACATDTAIQAGAAPAEKTDDMVCSREYPTGSNLPVTKCRTRAQLEAEREAAREQARRMQTTGSGVDGKR